MGFFSYDDEDENDDKKPYYYSGKGGSWLDISEKIGNTLIEGIMGSNEKEGD